jgi:HSP20 family protein
MSSLMRRDPFRGLMRMQRDLDRMFNDFFGRPVVGWEETQAVRIPTVDLSETADEVIVRAEVPGIDRENLEVDVLPEQVTIRAEVKGETEEKTETFHRRERSWGHVERTVPLPTEVVSDQAKATLKEGLLELRLPKSERAKAATPKKVKIE